MNWLLMLLKVECPKEKPTIMSVKTHKYYGRPDSHNCTGIALDCTRRPNSFIIFIHIKESQYEIYWTYK